MNEFSGLLIALAGVLGLIVFVEAKILKAIRLGKDIADELALKKNLKKNPKCEPAHTHPPSSMTKRTQQT